MNKIQSIKIADLQLNSTNFEITGIVINKHEHRTFTKNSGDQFYVFNFVLRDSKIDYINVTCWGSRNYIDDLLNKIHIATKPIKIKNPIVKLKSNETNQSDALFQPWTPSTFQLAVNENISTIELLQNNDQYDHLLTIPIRDHNDYFTLEDVTLANTNLVDKDLNLLFLIREVCHVEEIRTKNGKILQKLDVVVFDNTKPNFKLTIWDREQIRFAQMWQPMKNTIFANDVKIGYDQYRKSLHGVSTSRTIFIINPNTTEGYRLYNFGKTVRLPPILSEIDQIKSKALKCTVEEAKNLLLQDMFSSDFLLVNAFISEFNIDENFNKLFIKRCKGCNSIITQPNGICVKRTCDAIKNQPNNFYKSFELNISVSDHTGTLSSIRTTSKPFEKIMEYKIDENLSDEKVSDLKWKFLLERWSILINISSTVIENENNDLIKYNYRLIQLDHVDD